MSAFTAALFPAPVTVAHAAEPARGLGQAFSDRGEHGIRMNLVCPGVTNRRCTAESRAIWTPRLSKG